MSEIGVSRIASGGMVEDATTAGATTAGVMAILIKGVASTSEGALLMMTCAITTDASAVTSAMRRGRRGILAGRRRAARHHGAGGARARPLALVAATRATRATRARRRRRHADERLPRGCSTVPVYCRSLEESTATGRVSCRRGSRVWARAVTHASGYGFRRAAAAAAARATAAAQKELLVGALVLLIRCTAIYRRIS